jgi:hypothetical protein
LQWLMDTGELSFKKEHEDSLAKSLRKSEMQRVVHVLGSKQIERSILRHPRTSASRNMGCWIFAFDVSAVDI